MALSFHLRPCLMIVGIVFGIILLVDLISFIIYAAVFGLPQ